MEDKRIETRNSGKGTIELRPKFLKEAPRHYTHRTQRTQCILVYSVHQVHNPSNRASFIGGLPMWIHDLKISCLED